ncbi:FAD-binding oxidoreductase [Microbaculum sp. FT89]|uniref:FAD-binding oxidoreductase n=1 Tax=Microbaculum sp. FT89 TaxID=3447298 RepID=UPI003F5353D3
MTDLAALKKALEGLKIEDNPALVKQKSRDFFWYSPVLKRQLDAVTADMVVTPKSEAEVVQVLRTCFAMDVPVTVRGCGTGNYGQAMPLSGGIILNMAEMNRIIDIKPGRLVCEPGVILHDLDQAARADSGQEMRMHPSTAKTASIGGFIGGGSGGVGSIRWGGLRDLGNVLRLRVVTMEETPRVLELDGWDLQKVSHAYGTNGVITEVEIPLTAAYDWVDVIVGFDDFMDAARYGNALGTHDGLLLKLVTPIAAPIPHDYFLRHRKFIPEGKSVCLVMVAPHAVESLIAYTERTSGEILFRSDTAEDLKGLPPAFELAWNHTTLRGLRVDDGITYLQVLYPFPDQIELVQKVHAHFGDEVMAHLEFVRFDGNVTCFGLPIVRFTTEERLEEIMRIHEDMGCVIFNAHRYTLEEGGMKQTDEVQLAFKREADPKGLLNPGKMVAFEDPEFDFSAHKVYLFPGLEQAD